MFKDIFGSVKGNAALLLALIMGLTQVIKTLKNWEGAKAWLLAGVNSLIFVSFYQVLTYAEIWRDTGFTPDWIDIGWVAFDAFWYTFGVWATVTGLYKFPSFVRELKNGN